MILNHLLEMVLKKYNKKLHYDKCVPNDENLLI